VQMDEERREHVQKMKKMEAEMEQVFEMKVKEKLNKLKESEADVSYLMVDIDNIQNMLYYIEGNVSPNSGRRLTCREQLVYIYLCHNSKI